MTLRSKGENRATGILAQDSADEAVNVNVNARGSKRRSDSRRQKRDKLDEDNCAAIDDTAESFSELCPGLGRIFRSHVVSKVDKAQAEEHKLYLDHLQQVWFLSAPSRIAFYPLVTRF